MKRAALAALVAVACTARPVAPAAHAPARLELHVDARDARAVRVTGHFVGGASPKLALPDDTLAGLTRFEVLRGGAWKTLDPRALVAPECAADCSIRYTIDLDRVERSFEGVVAVGDRAWVAPSPTWIAHPDPMPDGTFDLTIDGAADAGDAFAPVPFATGLRRTDATHYILPTDDWGEGSFAAFGALRHRKIEAAGATIEIVLVSDTPLAQGDDGVARWIGEDAACVAQLYGRFPVKRATVFVVPMDGTDRVVFGKVLSLGGASVIALTGTKFPKTTTHSDWVVVHEMTHLGFPTMGVRWLTEGLATYYEPVLRERAGWLDAKALWSWFVDQMPRGVPAAGAELALDKRDTIDDVYWGGALFVLMADVAVRKATGGKKSFDDVMRAVLARGGDATVAWPLPDVLAVARETTGTNVVAELVDRFGVRGERANLDELFDELGVRTLERSESSAPKTGSVRHHSEITFDDAAPLAAIRRAIETGGH